MRASVAMWVVAVELAVMFAGATLPTPLYPLYRHAFGFSAITLTAIYAVYVLGNLIALLVFGRLSDQIGRRTVVAAAVAVAVAGTALFFRATATPWLFAARILSGLATGLAAGASTAWIAELQPARDRAAAASVASAANLAGLAVGPALAGSLAQFAPWPLRLVYGVYAAMLVGVVAAIAMTPETVSAPTRRLGGVSFRPRVGVPRDLRARFLAPAVTAFGTFALIGFYAALIPNVLAESLHQTATVVAGAVVFELFLVATVVVSTTRRLSAGTAMLCGLTLLPPSLALVVIAQVTQRISILLIAAALAGLAAAVGYRGSLEVVNGIAPDERRGEVVSSYLIAAYVGNSLPVIGIGLLSEVASSLVAHLVFAAVISAFSVAALATRSSALRGAGGGRPAHGGSES